MRFGTEFGKQLPPMCESTMAGKATSFKCKAGWSFVSLALRFIGTSTSASGRSRKPWKLSREHIRKFMLSFLTAYDPLGGSSGSMDPLGALQTYSFACGCSVAGCNAITTRSGSRSLRLARRQRQVRPVKKSPEGKVSLFLADCVRPTCVAPRLRVRLLPASPCPG